VPGARRTGSRTLERAVLAVPDRHQHLPGHAARPSAPCAAHRPGPASPRSRRCSGTGTRTTSGSPRSRTPGWCPSTATRRDRGGARHDQASVRDRAAAPACQAAGHVDPVRGAADARGRGRHHPGDQRGRGQQRAAAGPGHPGRAARRAASLHGGRGPGGPAGKYVDAFQRYDVDQLVTLLHEDALMTMPPYAMWIRGAQNVCRWMLEPSPSLCRGSILVPRGRSTGSCASPVQARPERRARALGAPGARGVGRPISRLTYFLDTERIFPRSACRRIWGER